MSTHPTAKASLFPLIAAVLAAAILRLRNQAYWRIAEQEAVDQNHDGIPDVYQINLRE
ncbi:hypothetical protein [Rhodococcus tibetensis]|uniref:Uncharacterized protein n=1 Tax=Rhodococcus tibetensis TaxID=2965064 RepID=A0ABT1QG72_9NOCA|nr:hypothetical protein [Rhodococcus sp. FXJ9.536]MCQ4121279.1 hypothetical protein [Rhodococcus sp. FXJ9.536]